MSGCSKSARPLSTARPRPCSTIFPTPADAEHLTFRQLRDAADIAPGRLNAVTCWDEDFVLAPGQPSAATGAAARESLLCAARDLKAGKLDAPRHGPHQQG